MLAQAVTERRQVFDAAVGNVLRAVAAHHQRQGSSFTVGGSSASGGSASLSRRRGSKQHVPCFAALLPGGGVGEEVFVSSITSFLNIYNTVLVARLLCTWFPQVPQQIVGPLATLSDPYLGAFRGLIPPLGGLDLSPILAFTVLNVHQSGAAALPAELEKGKSVRMKPVVQLARRKRE